MVHGRPAYIVARGPRTNGNCPGTVSIKDRPFRSCVVYSGFSASPSGVCHVRPSGSPPCNSFLARSVQYCGSLIALLITPLRGTEHYVALLRRFTLFCRSTATSLSVGMGSVHQDSLLFEVP